MDDGLQLLVGGLFVFFNGLVFYSGLRSGRLPYGWLGFKPLNVARESNPVMFWLVALFYLAVLVGAAIWSGETALRLLRLV